MSSEQNLHEVFVLIPFTARVKATGRSYTMNLHHYWHFRDGKIDRYRGSEDSAQTLEAFSDSRSREQTAATV
jgi:ketosteroid isomerase-like protein